MQRYSKISAFPNFFAIILHFALKNTLFMHSRYILIANVLQP